MPDRLTPSRLELRLDADIVAASTALEADCKRAELAAYQARLGRFDEVRSTLSALHQRYESRPNVQISSWLNLVEGLVGHFTDMDPAARDKVLRAYALSTAAGLTPMRALSAAWLAHLDYLNASAESMARHALEALNLASGNDHGARGRASLVVAQAYHFAGHFELSLPWYEQARSHAVDSGDDAAVSGLMHNMAWLRAHGLRQNAFLSVGGDDVNVHALLSAEATESFDMHIGALSLKSLVPVLRAQVLAVLGREAEALVLFEQYLDGALSEGLRRLQADLLADVAWCRLRVGQVERARECALAAEAAIDIRGFFDDRALAHSRLVQVFELLDCPDSADRHRQLSIQTWAGHALLQQRIVESLSIVPAVGRVRGSLS